MRGLRWAELSNATAEAANDGLRQPSVLVVDEDPPTLHLVSYLLDHAGVRVRTSVNEAEMVEAIRVERPDLILMDLVMFPSSGIDLMHRLKATMRHRDIPVVALTSYPENLLPRDFRDDGFASMITKPIDANTFSGRVIALVNAARSAAARRPRLEG